MNYEQIKQAAFQDELEKIARGSHRGKVVEYTGTKRGKPVFQVYRHGKKMKLDNGKLVVDNG